MRAPSSDPGAPGAAEWAIDPMSRALALAERGWGRVRPNPMVGAVVVREGRVVGEGWHERFGGDHAEIVALRTAGEAARGATLYVTLEPCAHHGKTPPCADAIVEAGVARVVYGASDPHPRAAGGARALAAAGVAVEGPVRALEVRSQNAAFYHRQAGKGPFVALKLALSLDGKLGLRGEETSVTGPEARAAALDLRAGYDAILVGSTTAAVDDPELTARGAIRPRRQPIRAVADTEARLSPRPGCSAPTRAKPGCSWRRTRTPTDGARWRRRARASCRCRADRWGWSRARCSKRWTGPARTPCSARAVGDSPGRC